MADQPRLTPNALLVIPLSGMGFPQSGVWAVGQIICDGNWDLWICIQSSDHSNIFAPISAVWRKLTGTGATISYNAEDLSSQVNGVTNTFTTSLTRQAGTLRVYRNGQDLGTPGTLVGGAEVEEISTTQFRVAVVPAVNEKLHVSYFV